MKVQILILKRMLDALGKLNYNKFQIFKIFDEINDVNDHY